MWTNLSIGAFRFRRVQIEEHRTGGGKMWTNLCFAAFRGALGVRIATSVPGRPPPLPDSQRMVRYSGPSALLLRELDRQKTRSSAGRRDRATRPVGG